MKKGGKRKRLINYSVGKNFLLYYSIFSYRYVCRRSMDIYPFQPTNLPIYPKTTSLFPPPTAHDLVVERVERVEK